MRLGDGPRLVAVGLVGVAAIPVGLVPVRRTDIDVRTYRYGLVPSDRHDFPIRPHCEVAAASGVGADEANGCRLARGHGILAWDLSESDRDYSTEPAGDAPARPSTTH